MANSSLRRAGTIVLTLTSLALVAAACGGGDDSGGSSGSGDGGGKPTPGGSVTYGLEAENSGGWCLPEAQLAISGIQVARSIYDTLTAPNADGQYVPFLAESVTPNDTSTEWTVKLRSGVKFHDGTPLTATVVKNNLDAYRGQYPARPKVLLFRFVFDNISAVDVVDDLTVKITTKEPWPALPAFLYGSGRIGIMAQAQLDDPETCDTKLIGTGPFELDEWVVNDHLSTSRNPDYWQKVDGTQLPYLDKLTYKPVVEDATRTNDLLSGQLQMIQTNTASEIESLNQAAENGEINVESSNKYAETAYIMLNTTKAPFDNQTAREAVAYALDRELFGKQRLFDQMTMASGPFSPGNVGYLEDSGFPKYDLGKAKELAQKYQQETGQPLEFTLTNTNSADNLQTMQFIQEQMAKAGIKVNIQPIEQAAQIDSALGSDWQAQYWRNHPGGDPDTQYIWWHSGLPTNFGKFKDPEIDALLEKGRTTTDPAERKTIYEDLNREFSKKLYNIWTNWSNWTIATATDVHGVMGPDLPDGTKPFPGLAAGAPVTAVWVEKGQ